MVASRLYDVCVIGAGPAGAACAIQLAKEGLLVALIGKEYKRPSRAGEMFSPELVRFSEQFCSDIPFNSGHSIRYVGTNWESSKTEFRDLSLWQAGFGISDIRMKFDDCLIAQVEQLEVCHRRTDVSSGTLHSDNLWELRLDSGECILTKMVFEASGRAARSPLVDGVKRSYLDRLACVHFEQRHDGDHNNTVLVQACSQGWWYNVPLKSGNRFVAMFTDADILRGRNKRKFLEQSALELSDHSLFVPTAEVSVNVVDARTSLRTHQYQVGWLPIGDSAFTLDPLSGNGVSRACQDGLKAAKTWADVNRDQPDRTHNVMQEYAMSRLSDSKKMLQLRLEIYSRCDRWKNETFWRRRRFANT